MVFFLAWLFAFMLGPLVNRVYAIPFMTRTGAIFIVYFLLFGGARRRLDRGRGGARQLDRDFIENLPALRENLPAILAPWQERLNAPGHRPGRPRQPGHGLPRQHQPVRDPARRAAPADRGREPRGDRQPAARRRAVAVHGRGPRAARGLRFWLVPARLQGRGRDPRGGGQPVIRWLHPRPGHHGPRVRGDLLPGERSRSGSTSSPVTTFDGRGADGDPVLRAVRRVDPAGARGDAVQARRRRSRSGSRSAIGWLVVMNWLQPRIMSTSLRIHPIVVLGSVLVGLKIAGIPGAIFGIPIAAVISALFLHASIARARQRAGRRARRRARGPARRPADSPAARAEPAAPTRTSRRRPPS